MSTKTLAVPGACFTAAVSRRPRTRQDPEAPELPERLEDVALDPRSVARPGGWSQVRVVGSALPDVQAAGVRVDRFRLEAVDLGGGRLPNLALVDGEVVDCNLANVVSRGSSLRRVNVVRGRLTGLVWLEGTIEDTAFRDCRIDLASFAASTLRRVTFDSCRLAGSDFRDGKLEDVAFRECDLSDADVSGAQFERSELRGCRLDGLAGVLSLRGSAMEWPDVVAMAGTFAAALGIDVLE